VDNDLMARGQAALSAQAFSRLLGTQLVHFEAGAARLELAVRDDHLQQHGFVHGGVLSYLADNALTFAGGSVLGDSVTSEYKINYVRPAPGGSVLVAEATAVASGKTQAVCRCDVFMQKDGKRQLCAAAQGTIRKVEG
jgi:uncharacterized protein (TIGR00369 family)